MTTSGKHVAHGDDRHFRLCHRDGGSHQENECAGAGGDRPPEGLNR